MLPCVGWPTNATTPRFHGSRELDKVGKRYLISAVARHLDTHIHHLPGIGTPRRRRAALLALYLLPYLTS